METLDKKYELKKFFMNLYRNGISEGNNLKSNEYIIIFQNNDKFNKNESFKNIDSLVNYIVQPKNLYCNTYFNLATTDGEGRKRENLKTVYFLGFDFDKKDLNENCNISYIQNKFKEVGLYYHAIVNSGNGLHFYVCIEPTNNIDLVNKVTREISKRLGADEKATLTTQVLRVPFTKNVKESDNTKNVTLVHLENKETIKRKSIETLSKRFLTENTSNINTKFVLNMNIQPCIANILKNGSIEGSRNKDLQKIVVALRLKNKTLESTLAICKEWNGKNSKSLPINELEYQVKYIYKNIKNVNFDCSNCSINASCWNNVVSDFEYTDGEELITLSESHTKYLKKSNRKGARTMNGNDLLLYGILKNHNDGLLREEIVKELTYKNKRKKIETVALSEKTLTETLKSLEENKFITVEMIGRRKLYKLNDIRSKVELTYNISYGATYEAIKGSITTDELRLYNYMRYLHNKEQRENPKALKGNLFQINQSDLAKDLGVTQGRISVMINNLLDEKLLSVWHRQPSKNNGFEYYVYRLNY